MRATSLISLVITACLVSCLVPAQLPAPPPVPTQPLSEEDLRPEQRPEVTITDLDETVGPGPQQVTVMGTLVNQGTGATRAVFVRVEALDRDGAVVVGADSEPIGGVIPPGATARFSVLLENRADIDRYHVEALAR